MSGCILIFTHTLLPLSQTFILDQARSMKRHRPAFMSCSRNDQLYLHCRPSFVVRDEFGKIGKLADALFKFGCPLPKAETYVKSQRPRLIHAHFGTDAAFVLPLAARHSLPLVVTFHGSDVIPDQPTLGVLGSRIYDWRRRWLRRFPALFIAVSAFVRGKLLQRGFPEERIKVHYTGVDTSFFSSDVEVARQPIVLFVGRLIPLKGAHLLIEAVARLQFEIPEIKLVCIGDGPEREACERLARERLSNFRFLGAQSRSVVKEYLSIAKVLCSPSHTHRTGCEAFGMALIEAQSMGTPVVAFAHGGVLEAVAHEETGLLATEGNVDQMAHYLKLLLSNSDLWRTMSIAARQRVIAKFSLETQTQLLENLYDEVVRPR